MAPGRLASAFGRQRCLQAQLHGAVSAGAPAAAHGLQRGQRQGAKLRSVGGILRAIPGQTSWLHLRSPLVAPCGDKKGMRNGMRWEKKRMRNSRGSFHFHSEPILPFRKPSNTQGKQRSALKRAMLEKNGHPNPREIQTRVLGPKETAKMFPLLVLDGCRKHGMWNWTYLNLWRLFECPVGFRWGAASPVLSCASKSRPKVFSLVQPQ